MYKIERGYPIPEAASRQGLGRRPLYPFADMAVGESISVPLPEKSRAADAAKHWAHRHPGWRFFCGADLKGGVRLWRTT